MDDWAGAEDPDWKADHQLEWGQLTDVKEIGKVRRGWGGGEGVIVMRGRSLFNHVVGGGRGLLSNPRKNRITAEKYNIGPWYRTSYRNSMLEHRIETSCTSSYRIGLSKY